MPADGTPPRTPDRDVRRLTTAQWIVLGLCAAFILVVLYFAYRRVHIDIHNITGNPRSIDPNDAEYAAHPVLAYLHIAPGVVYLLGACLQLSRRFRTRHYLVHRRMGRVVAACGLRLARRWRVPASEAVGAASHPRRHALTRRARSISARAMPSRRGVAKAAAPA